MKPRTTRFIADAMLGSLARKLRAVGFDTAYYREGDDDGLLRLAESEARLILTADTSLGSRARKKGLTAFLVHGKTDGARMSSISSDAKLLGIRLNPGDSRCSVCNGSLRRITKALAEGLVPKSVLPRHRLFLICLSCGQVYWRGGHWKKLRSFRRRLR